MLHSDGSTILDQSKKSSQTPVGLLVTPIDLETSTPSHTSTTNPQPNTPHNPNTLHTAKPSTEHHASSSKSHATEAIPTILHKDILQHAEPTLSPNTTHNTILTPTCRTTSEQLGTTTGRSTPPNQEQPSAMVTELSKSLLDSGRGSTRESIEGTSPPHTEKHTFRTSDNQPDSRTSHSIPNYLSHRRDTTTLEGTPNGGEYDNFRAERHRSPRKPDNLSSHGELATLSTISCEGDEYIGHRSAPTCTVIQDLNRPVQGQPDSTTILQSGSEPPSSRFSRTLSRLSSEGLRLEEARDESRPNDRHT